MVTRAPARMTAEVRWSAFVDEYIKDFNGTRAYMRAYGVDNVRSAGAAASALLKNEWVREQIRTRSANRLTPNDITPDRIVLEMARLGLSDIGKVVAVDGNDQRPLLISELDEDTRRAIKEIEFTPMGVRIKLADKLPALQAMARVMGMVGTGNTKTVPGTSASVNAADYESCDEEEILRLLEAAEAEEAVADEDEPDTFDMNVPDHDPFAVFDE